MAWPRILRDRDYFTKLALDRPPRSSEFAKIAAVQRRSSSDRVGDANEVNARRRCVRAPQQNPPKSLHTREKVCAGPSVGPG